MRFDLSGLVGYLIEHSSMSLNSLARVLELNSATRLKEFASRERKFRESKVAGLQTRLHSLRDPKGEWEPDSDEYAIHQRLQLFPKEFIDFAARNQSAHNALDQVSVEHTWTWNIDNTRLPHAKASWELLLTFTPNQPVHLWAGTVQCNFQHMENPIALLEYQPHRIFGRYPLQMDLRENVLSITFGENPVSEEPLLLPEPGKDPDKLHLRLEFSMVMPVQRSFVGEQQAHRLRLEQPATFPLAGLLTHSQTYQAQLHLASDTLSVMSLNDLHPSKQEPTEPVLLYTGSVTGEERSIPIDLIVWQRQIVPEKGAFGALQALFTHPPTEELFRVLLQILMQRDDSLWIKRCLEIVQKELKDWPSTLQKASLKDLWPSCPQQEPAWVSGIIKTLTLSPDLHEEALLGVVTSRAFWGLEVLHLNGYQPSPNELAQLAQLTHLTVLGQSQEIAQTNAPTGDVVLGLEGFAELRSLLSCPPAREQENEWKAELASLLREMDLSQVVRDFVREHFASSSDLRRLFVIHSISELERAIEDFPLPIFTISSMQLFEHKQPFKISKRPSISYLTGVEIFHHELGEEGAKAIASASQLKNLTSLKLKSNKIGDSGVKWLVSSKHLRGLRELSLINNRISMGGGLALSKAATFSHLRNLCLKDNNLGPVGIEALLSTSMLPALQSLDLSGNKLGQEGATALTAIEQTSLMTLNLSKCDIGLEGARILANAKLHSLQELLLEENALRDEGIEAFSIAEGYQQLNRLDLSSNSLGDESINALLQAPFFAQLQTLSLKLNVIGNQGLQAIAKNLSHERFGWRLKQLDLSYNEIGDEGVKALSQVPSLRGLVELALNTNEIGDEGAFEIAKAASFAFLDSLRLDDNHIGYRGMQALGESDFLRESIKKSLLEY